MKRKPRLFIGSSVEGRMVASEIQRGLEHDVESVVWDQGVFGLSKGTLESLVDAGNDFDYAALVLTSDDLMVKRGENKNSPRDNVIFELGLFMGSLGRERTFMVYCRDDKPDLPTDLAGITAATFPKRDDENLQAALGTACTQIRSAIQAIEENAVARLSKENDELRRQIADAQPEELFNGLVFSAMKRILIKKDLWTFLDKRGHTLVEAAEVTNGERAKRKNMLDLCVLGVVDQTGENYFRLTGEGKRLISRIQAEG